MKRQYRYLSTLNPQSSLNRSNNNGLDGGKVLGKNSSLSLELLNGAGSGADNGVDVGDERVDNGGKGSEESGDLIFEEDTGGWKKSACRQGVSDGKGATYLRGYC